MQGFHGNFKHQIVSFDQQSVQDFASVPTGQGDAGHMPRQTCAAPEGEILALPSRRTLRGDRLRLHLADGTIGPSLWRTRGPIAHALEFGDRRGTIMTPGSHAELFFLHEATASAAGHRPCAECRRRDFRGFREICADAFGAARAPGIDAARHAARAGRDRGKVPFAAPAGSHPDGTMIRRRQGMATVLTPAPLVARFRGGLRPGLHLSAGAPPRASIEPQISRG
jgi:hypothetical protein